MTDPNKFKLTVNTPEFKEMMEKVHADLDKSVPIKDVCLAETAAAQESFMLKIQKLERSVIRPYIYDRKGKNISLDEWSRLNGDEDYRRIGLLEIGDYILSTVWNGISYNGQGIFETVVFSNRDEQGFGSDPIWEERYPSEEIAIGLHQIMANSITEIYNSSPSPFEKKRRVLLALERLQRFLHPEEPEDDHIDEVGVSKPFPSETIHLP